MAYRPSVGRQVGGGARRHPDESRVMVRVVVDVLEAEAQLVSRYAAIGVFGFNAMIDTQGLQGSSAVASFDADDKLASARRVGPFLVPRESDAVHAAVGQLPGSRLMPGLVPIELSLTLLYALSEAVAYFKYPLFLLAVQRCHFAAVAAVVF